MSENFSHAITCKKCGAAAVEIRGALKAESLVRCACCNAKVATWQGLLSALREHEPAPYLPPQKASRTALSGQTA